jgi:hypothetical protein
MTTHLPAYWWCTISEILQEEEAMKKEHLHLSDNANIVKYHTVQVEATMPHHLLK